MTASSQTTMVRRQLGRRLRRLREAAGKSALDVTHAGVASKAKLSRIENGWTVTKIADVRALCWLYEADVVVTESLARMAAGTVRPGWWEDRAPRVDRLYPALEQQASRMCCYENELVPPLLRTSDYVRALAGSATTPGTVERNLGELAYRVRVGFERVVPLQVCALLDAAVLNRAIGGPEVMTSQIRKLLQQNRLPSTDIRVLPWNAAVHAALRGSFSLLEFDRDEDPPVACVETTVGTRYAEEREQIAHVKDLFAAAWAQALPLGQYLSTAATAPFIDLRGVTVGQVG